MMVAAVVVVDSAYSRMVAVVVAMRLNLVFHPANRADSSEAVTGWFLS